MDLLIIFLIFVLSLFLVGKISYRRGYKKARKNFSYLLIEVIDNISYELRGELKKEFSKALEKLDKKFEKPK